MTGDRQPARRAKSSAESDTPWVEGIVSAMCVAVVVAVGVVVLSLGLAKVHPLWAVLLNIVAVGGLSPTLWGWRERPVLRWFVLGIAIGIAGGWLAAVVTALIV
ncbi:transmembrane protein [Mycolicibacterium phlei]|uniref:DUF2537 domain-containing protein n=1 Tax=Mycobacteroides chelonae TaxID=1774 RepID=UPI0007B4428B|nr:DUF2537 domain-containing protein [Mycobacteroides chelonae]ANA97032.1 membrane protein [Mycobacteroides chelonae CCUG 47445]VEG14958.1 transmembrane protein [Mycolicibacterium phlei]